jgi:non-ribosomal peptide synthetase component E (peptide arylation enzyme)
MAVHRIIEAHAARYGDSPAISDTRNTLSYRELNQQANIVARHFNRRRVQAWPACHGVSAPLS